MRVPTHRARRLVALAVASLLLSGAAAGDRPALQPPRISRERMEAALDGRERFLIVYGTQDRGAAAPLRERAMALARRYAEGDSSQVKADRDLDVAALAGRHVILLGGPRENRWAQRLAPALPASFGPDGFRWQGTDYTRPGDVLHLIWPNPLDPTRFMILIAANSPAALTRRAGRAQFGAKDWRIYRDGELARSGTFAHAPGRPWRYDPALDQDLEAARARHLGSLRVLGRGAVRVRSAPGTAGAVLVAAEALTARLDRMGFADARRPPLELTLHGSLEDKGRLTRDTRPEHVDPSGAAQVAYPAGQRALDLWSVAAARLRQLGAGADSPWLMPAGVWLSGRLDGEPIEAAVKRLVGAGLLPAADEVVVATAGGDAEAVTDWCSPFILNPARAILVRALYETAGASGRPAVLSLLRGPVPATLEALGARAGVPAAALRRRYTTLADSLARGDATKTHANPPRPWGPADGFQSGVCLAHAEGLEGGYLSATCGRELARLRAAGAGWISLTPFGYLRDRAMPIIYTGGEGYSEGESDEALCEAAARARAVGLRVWLKPHLWTRGFVGELEFDPAGWSRFFEGYREFILHYALLAERQGMDGLVIGHELSSAALGHPGRWRALIADVRRVYHGTLTYGANWGEEVRGVTFWDALDLVGVSLYTPLADAPTHDVARLEAGARLALAELKEVSRRAGRPVLIVEGGYAPTRDAPVRPWEERGGARDLEAQRACYEALVGALASERWVAGVFWWKWFSDAGTGGPLDGSHTPRGKPAEAVMRRAFADWAGRPVSAPPVPPATRVLPGRR